MLDESNSIPRLVDDSESNPAVASGDEWTFAACNLPTGWLWQPPFFLPTGGWIVIVYNVAGNPNGELFVAARSLTRLEAIENLGATFENYGNEEGAARWHGRWLIQ